MTDSCKPNEGDALFEPDELRSFGRRRGRALSARQTTLLDHDLPRLRVDMGVPSHDPAELFDFTPTQVWLEIGFGGAEHLLWQAEQNPDVGLIGCEPFQDGVVKALAGVAENNLTNIRLWDEDARPLVKWLPTASIDRIFVLFPDPWPKKRQQKRRLLNVMMFQALSRILRPGGQLRIGTDIGDYARTILAAVSKVPNLRWTARRASDWRERPHDWPQTRYEAKGIEAGRRCTYLTLTRD